MRPGQIFISYRRDDTAGYARALYDKLAESFGADRVFIDVDDIDAGQPFNEVIDQAVGSSKVLLVLIGRRWLGERDAGPPRIADPGNFVRLEVAAGLARGAHVIPLLLDGEAMPGEAQLPEELRPLARRNALEIANTRFAADSQRLVDAVRASLGEPPSWRWKAATVWAAVGVLLVAGAVFATWKPTGSAPPKPVVAVARPDVNGAWQAEVVYDWPNARYAERFVLAGDGDELHGTASFLGQGRGILEGRVAGGGLSFVTRTAETSGDGGASVETAHRYRGHLVGDELRFVMQTEGGISPHEPVEFVARRAPGAVVSRGSGS